MGLRKILYRRVLENRIVNLCRLYTVDCSVCKSYTVIKLSTNYICIVVNIDSIW